MLKEFKAFISKGNVVDLAVAVIIGAAFGSIVSSLVADIITPLILNPVMEHLDIKNLENVQFHGIKYGKFLAAVINFFIVAFCVFLFVKTINRVTSLRRKQEEEGKVAPPPPTKDQQLLMEIRDLLKEKQSK